MKNLTDRNVKIRYSINNQIFHYSGKVVANDEDFLEINDRKEGLICLNKSLIISLQVGASYE